MVALAAARTVHTNGCSYCAGTRLGRKDSVAVVSLVPQEQRLFTVLQVVEADDPEVPVISHFDRQMGLTGSGEPQQQMDVTDFYEEHNGNCVICFTQSAVATIGEAFAVCDIAAQKSWETVTVVVSRWHAFRAHDIFKQYIGDDTDVNLMHADSDELSALDWFVHIAFENTAFSRRGGRLLLGAEIS